MLNALHRKDGVDSVDTGLSSTIHVQLLDDVTSVNDVNQPISNPLQLFLDSIIRVLPQIHSRMII